MSKICGAILVERWESDGKPRERNVKCTMEPGHTGWHGWELDRYLAPGYSKRDDTMKNRSQLARERAGLSLGQAARLLNMSTSDLGAIEERATIMPDHANRLAELYRVRVEWLAGEVELRDYATVDAMKDADRLTSHDRDVVAEFAASLPRKP